MFVAGKMLAKCTSGELAGGMFLAGNIFAEGRDQGEP